MVTYNRDIPDAPNNPSVDQPKMKTNTNSIDTLLAVDHIGFNATNGGIHKQTAFEVFSAGAIPGGTPSSVAYPAAGLADTSRAQYFFKDSTNTNYLLSGIKAFAFCAPNGSITGGQSSNVSLIVNNIPGKYTINVAPNVLKSSNYLVFISASQTSNTQMVHSYNILSATSFELFFSFPLTGLLLNPSSFCFVVIQI